MEQVRTNVRLWHYFTIHLRKRRFYCMNDLTKEGENYRDKLPSKDAEMYDITMKHLSNLFRIEEVKNSILDKNRIYKYMK